MKTQRIFILTLVFIELSCFAQELEPRALTNVPLGMNFVIAGYGYSQGNLLLDPSIPIEDLESRLHSGVLGYLRAINFFGASAKVDVIVPMADGFFDGHVDGVYKSREMSGFGDARIRLSVNFSGAPALKPSDYVKYKSKRIVGASLQVVMPTGQYDPNKLINLGSNRWAFKPQLGIAFLKSRWTFESYFSAWITTSNDNFYGGLTITQDPIFSFKQHIIYSFRNGMWLTLDGGYGVGGRNYIEGMQRDTRISTFRFGSTFAIPIKKRHTIRLTFNSGVRLEKGADYDAVIVSYQYRWVKTR